MNFEQPNLNQDSEKEKMTKIIATEKLEKRGEQKRELTDEDLHEATEELEDLMDGLESDKGVLGTIGKYSGKILALGAIFPGAVRPLLEAFSNSNPEKAEVAGKKYTPFGEGLKNAFDQILADYKALNQYVSNSQFEKELERLKKKAGEIKE
ncbi:MAG: hypothetical protein WCT19_00805 [Candidatus Paceibacterota bacterium]